MTASTAIDAYGMLLKIGDGEVAESFTAIANCTNLNPPPIDREEYETTHHDGSGWDEWIMGVKRGGQITLDVDWVPTEATHGYTSGLLKDWDDGTKRNWQLVWPDVGATTWTFAAFVKTITPAAPAVGKLTATVTLRISDSISLA